MSGWRDLTALLASAPGEYSLCVCELDGRRRYGYNEHVLRSSASLIKVPLAMTVIDVGIDLDARLTLAEADRVEGDGSFDCAAAGTIKTVRELLAHALIESDNTASNLLIDQVGMDVVNRWLADHGFTTRLRRKFMDFAAMTAGRDNTTTAADMCAIFQYALQPQYADLIALLKQVAGEQKLEAELPPATILAHKLGNLDAPIVEHDAGIVFGPRKAYIIAALSVGAPAVVTARRTIAAASRIVWNEMQRSES